MKHDMLPETAQKYVVKRLTDLLSTTTLEFEVEPAGSIVLGTYVGEPDIDVFIKTKAKNIEGIFELVKTAYDGYIKIGALKIFATSVDNYDVDIVIVDGDDPKTQTLLHTSYFKDKLTDIQKTVIKRLKKRFKSANCYGAETGGITGIAITTIVSQYTSTTTISELENYVYRHLRGTEFVEDPTLKGRNLLASILPFRWIQVRNPNTVGMVSFLANHNRVISIPYDKSYGKDRQFQRVYKAVNKSFNQIKQDYRWWNPNIRYDIYFEGEKIYIGYQIVPHLVLKPFWETIPVDILSQKNKDIIMSVEGANITGNGHYINYPRYPQHPRVEEAFEHHLIHEIESHCNARIVK